MIYAILQSDTDEIIIEVDATVASAPIIINKDNRRYWMESYQADKVYYREQA